MNERGSILLGALFLAVMISLSLGSFMYQIDNARNTTNRNAARTNAEAAQIALQMIWSKPATCTGNLTAQNFGTTLAEIQARSTAGTLQGVLPNLNIADPPVQLAANTAFNRVQINKMYFSAATQVFPPDPAYIANLTLEVTPFGSPLVRHIVMPFYFEADAGGLLTSCVATGRPNSRGAAVAGTEEDELCQHWYDSNARYRHYGRYCETGP